MRLIYFLLVSLIFTACGHQKLRFSRVKQKQKVVEISEIPNLKKKVESTFAVEVESEEASTEIESSSITVSSSDESEENNNFTPQNQEVLPPKTLDDSTTVTAEEVEYMTQEALLAEKKGTWSLITSIMAPLLFIGALLLFAFSIFGGLGPVGAILSLILGIGAIASTVLSYVFGVSSLRAPYNTPKGRKRAIAGLIIISTMLFLFLINFGIGFL